MQYMLTTIFYAHRNKFCKNYEPKALITLMYNSWVFFCF